MSISRTLLAILIPLNVAGQVFDDFSDGNFNSDPQWFGQTQSFVINENYALQLQHIGAGEAYLSTVSHTAKEAQWEFDLMLDFNPSARNFCRIYLISDHHQLSENVRGYYVLLGGSKDQVSLYRQDLSEHQEIIPGLVGVTDRSPNKLSIKVNRSIMGQWQLHVDTVQNQQYQLMGTVTDDTHQRANYFGVFCQFTTTRSNGFYFDNIRVSGEEFQDLQPPVIEAIHLIDDHQLEVKFDEAVRIAQTTQIQIPGVGHPSKIIETAYATWQFSFPSPFKHGDEYILKLIEVVDLFGNATNTQQKFTFWEIQPADKHDVVITEVMADPVPSIKLAQQEYLELFNSSDKAINLKNWVLTDQNTNALLPDYLLTPGEYLVLHPRPQMASSDINSLAIDPWPTLNNTGDLVSLADSAGNIIHFVNYRHSWYRNDLKSHGGWSLEMIDARYPCTGSDNWTASESFSGGTPGLPNSVATDNPDLTPPVIISSFAITPLQLRICFDQPLGSPVAGTRLNIEPSLRMDTFFIESIYEPCITVKLIDSLESGILYSIETDGFSDCNLNTSIEQGTKGLVGLPLTADLGDLIINEILFNPRPLGVTFVELYNRSDKPINLKNWHFARWQSQKLVDLKPLAKSDHVVYPGEYRVFTADINRLLSHYPKGRSATMIEVDELPVLGDSRGSLALMDSDGQIMDSLNYSKDMHHALLIDQKGVSLERADPNSNIQGDNNWFSGSETSGYATPGYRNAQYYQSMEKVKFKVEPQVLSPLTGSFPNYVRVSFSLNQPGSSGTLLIFNRKGHLVRTLVRNSLLATKGTFQWDGTDDSSRRVPMGYYLIYFEVTGKNFSSSKWMQTIAVAPDGR